MSRKKKPVTLLKNKAVNSTTRNELKAIEDKLKGNADDLVDVPYYLDDLAKQYYIFLLNELEIGDLLCNLDKPILEQTADCLSKIRKADDIINKEGIQISQFDRYGNEKSVENPMIKTKMTYLQRYQTLSNELGLSPSARASLASLKLEQKQEQADPLLQVLRG